MYLSWRMCITMVVVSLYFGGCQAAVGTPCSGVSDCTGTGEICSNGVCVCDPATQYTNGVVCVTKVAAGLSCDGLPIDACSTNSACVDTICTCNQGFYDSDGGGSSGTCVPQVAAGNNCAGLPTDACSTNSACVDTICTCNQGFYDSDGGGSSGTCIPQIALSGTCVNSLGVTQCVTSGAVCETDNTCRCSTGTFDDNGFNTAGGVCQDMSLLVVTGVTSTNLGTSSVTISWTAPATYSGQVNRYEVTWTSSTQGGGTRSVNTATFLGVTGLKSATGYSFTVKTFESGSQMSEQQVSSSPALTVTTESQLSDTCGTCADVNSVCSTTCVCKDGYYDNNGNSVGGTCVRTINAGKGPCNNIANECTANSACSGSGGSCVCGAGFYDSGATCASKVVVGNNCAGLPADACSTNSACVNNICTCNPGFYDSDGPGSSGTCVPQVAAGNNCDGLPTDACSTNSACVNTICTCNPGFYDSDGPGSSGTCVSQIALSGTCVNSLGVTQCVTSGAVCETDNKCRCSTGTFDDNGFSTAGGVCQDMSLLVVTGVTSTNLGTSSVTISWTAPATYSGQVNRYEVTWTSSTQGGGTRSVNTATFLDVTGLQSATQYSFTVKTFESGSQMSEQQVSSSPALTVTTESQLGDTCGTCADVNSVCSTTCVCKDGYYDNNGNGVGGTCVRKIALSGACNSGLVGVSQCSDVKAECTSNLCRCKAGYYDSNGFSPAGGTCTDMSTLKVLSVTVTEGTDTAIVTWTPPTDASQVNRYQVIWSPPKTDGSSSFDAWTALTATISGFTSGATYTFSVKTVESGSRTTSQEIESDFPKTVAMKAALSVACGTSSPIVVCADTTTASCTSNVCRCNENYYDSNGYGTSGGVCTPMSNLKVPAITLSSVTTTGVTISWTAPTDSSQVSGYTVVWRMSGSTTVVGSSSVANSLTTAVITGLTQRTTYIFNVKSSETGSRSTTQEVESDSSVTITTKAELSEMCDGAILCGDVMSQCIAGNSGSGVCRCQSGYYDSNGYSTSGGVCTDMNGLIVTSLTVGVEGTSTVTIEWLVPSTGSDQVNRYEVHWTPALANGTVNYNAEKATSARLTGFVSGQQYTFYVKSIETGSRATPQEVQTTSKTITINAGLNVICDGGIQCADSNAECTQADGGTNNICRCKLSYFDSNGYSNPGGMCITMPTLAVTGLTLAKEGTDRVNVSWTPPSQYTDQVSRYEVHWSPSATINGNPFYNALLTTAVQLVGFVPGQTYNFTVRSVESGSRSQEQNTVTPSSPLTMKPSTPSGFTETDVDGPEIILSWSAPSGIKTSYDVTTTPTLTPTTTSTESITFTTNVLDGHQYNISITTVSGSERSDPLLTTFRTVSKTPDPPTGLGCTVTTDKTVTLTWTAPVYPNGDIQHYVVNSITTNAMFSTSTSQTEYTVDGLQPETMYRFSVATLNDAVMETNQSQYSLEKDCWTKAAMSLEPNTLVVSQEQSRQFTLNWTKPTLTNGDLWGYRLKVLDGSTCVQEVLFTCNTCTGYTAFPYTCPEGAKQTQAILPTDLDSFTYTVENLLPYINYTVSVVAVNAAGDGHPNTQYAMTDQEVPQNPTTLTATVASSTEVDVTWDISDPRPGPTTFTLYIIAEAPESSRTETIQGFSVRTYKVVGLEEYRSYTFNLTASTVKGSAVYQQTPPSAKTLAADPGAVGSFVVDRPDGPNYTTVRVSWQLPAILDRNSDITKFMFSHNTTGGNLNAAPEEIPTVDSVTRNLAVLPQNTYYIEVYAIGTNPNGEIFNGVKSTETYLAPAGSPPLDVGETVIPTSSNNNIQATQTSFTLTLTDDFFKNSLYGSIEDYSLVLCKDSCKTLGDQSEAVSHDYLARLDGWKDARANGYTDEYRAMSKADFITYLNQASTSGRRRKRATNSFVVNIGTATDCATSTETYCNGPLEAGSIYFVKAVVCTVGGCTLSTLYGPYSTEKVPDPGTDVGVIVGVVCGIVAFALVIVLLVFIVKRRQSSKPTTQLSDIDVDGFREIDKKQINDKRPVVMERFPQHVADLHKDSKLKFAKEYEDLKELSPRHPCTAANEDGNKMKNRYVNILPFDHSRVKLNPSDPEDPSTDFINANYIPGYNSQREYIASQGPIPGTIDDFWRMIWEQQVAICVMLTLCKEDGRIKCEQYWPTERNEPKQYGDIVVEITSYSTVNTYDFRIFKLTQGDQTRTLKHFHFLNWKDFSANVQNDVMIDFIQNVRAHIQPPDKKGPMLIHCSAGVGRTGTYISLDQLIQFIDEHDFSEELDIFDLVLSMRNYRVFMVQTEQQYVFIHDCAKDLIERKRERLQENDGESDENIYINKAYEQDAEENIYQNENFHQTAKTEL